MKSVFMYTSKYDAYSLGDQHPFKPYKATMVYELCYRYSLFDKPWITVMEPEPAQESALTEYHSRDYIEALKAANTGSFDFTMLEYGLGTSDNPVFKGVYDFSLLVLGATLKSTDLIMSSDADIVFSPVGGLHHGGLGHAEGFCYINDIVIAILRLLKGGYERVLYVDIDAHHGNGVQDAFYDRDDVMTVSFHQSGETLYPWGGFENEMGSGKGLGYTVNVPLSEYTDDEAYIRVFREIYTPLVRAYKPQCVVAQIGLDTLKKDPLTNLRLTNNGYCEVIAQIRQSCEKIIALGGGGYSVPDVVRGWTLAWAELNSLQPHDPYLGLVGGALTGHGTSVEDLRDKPYRIAPRLKDDVNRYLDSKIAFIKENIFPIHAIT